MAISNENLDRSQFRLFWSWLEAQKVTTAFDQCLEICEDLGLKHVTRTYNSFMDALTRYRARFDELIPDQFLALPKTAGDRFFRSDDWARIGFDDSRVTTPKTVCDEKAFCAPNDGSGVWAKYGKKQSKGTASQTQPTIAR